MNAQLITPAMARTILAQVDETGVTPLHEARVYDLVIRAGYTVREVAAIAAERPSRIALRLALLSLIAPATAALEAGNLPVGLAWYVAKLSETSQRIVLAAWLRGAYTDSQAACVAASQMIRDENPHGTARTVTIRVSSSRRSYHPDATCYALDETPGQDQPLKELTEDDALAAGMKLCRLCEPVA